MAGMGLQVTGGQSFGNLSKRLKAAGPDLRKGYLAAIRKATAPAKRTIPESARRTLPRRGGFNEVVASQLKVATRTSLSGSEASVRIVATEGPKRRVRDLDRGRLRHPTFGHQPWVDESVTPGFFTRPCLPLRPDARKQIVAATNEVLRKLAT